jgi:class 3 adenylate cyclase
MIDDPDLTLDAFLALHPWPAEDRARRRLEWFWTFDLPVEPAALWRAIADTSRMNRALGVGEMKFEDRDGLRCGSSGAGLLRQTWIEEPWDWVAGEWLTSVRRYDRGFADVVYGAFHLSPRPGGGTRLHAYFGAVPRGFFSALVLRYAFSSLGKAYRRILPAVAADVAALTDDTPPPSLMLPGAGLGAEIDSRLATISRDLHDRGLDGAAVDHLVTWISTGDEQDLYRIQVRERALAWGLAEDALLRVCLHATRVGLLELSWDLICPHCRGVTGETGKLGALPAEAGCEVCGIDFGTGTAEAVEITFHVHPSIRDVPRRTFCSGEPAAKDHIRVQRAVPPGASVVVTPDLAPGRYRMRIHGEKRYGYLDVGAARAPGGSAAAEIVWSSGADPAEHAAGPLPVLRLVNDAAEERRFIVEAAQWSDTALRPGRLLSFQEFRDLFAQEYLGEGVQLGIGEQTILFTDMVGSTALYAERGDPAAFLEVKRHFDAVITILGEHRGALVKTIGDAAMGAFPDPLDAVKAARAIQDRFHKTRADSLARLRISLNTGPCIAVHLNTGIDYFGHTVNVAAKLQSLAESWQIAMSEAVYRAPGVAAWLADQGAVLEDVEYTSKALRQGIAVKRWTVYQ